jgi:hypothetical protein
MTESPHCWLRDIPYFTSLSFTWRPTGSVGEEAPKVQAEWTPVQQKVGRVWQDSWGMSWVFDSR